MGPLKRIGFFLRLVLPLLLRTRRRPVLFVRQGALGDILCTFPAALELKKRHPRAEFIYSCSSDFACLPRMGGVTHHVTSAHVDRRSQWTRWFSAVYHFSYNAENGRLAEATLSEEFCRQHGVVADGGCAPLQIKPAFLTKMQTLLRRHGVHQGPLVLLHPGPTWPIKEWPATSWATLVQELRRRGFTNIVQLGVNRHGQLGALPRIVIPDVLPLADQLTVEETIALVSLADLLIGIDSGLMHIAASVKIPAVGIFGPTSPRFLYADTALGSFLVSRVECQGCHHRLPRLHWMTGCPHDVQCMKTISVADVLQAVLHRLDSAQKLPREK